MRSLPIILALIPVLFFCWASYRERANANSLTRFFLFGDPLKRTAFLATLGASNTALGAVVFVITVFGYYYGLGFFPWVVLFWLTTQWAAAKILHKIEKESVKTGGFIANNGTLHEYLGEAFSAGRVRVAAAVLSVTAYLGLITAESIIGLNLFDAIVPSHGAAMEVAGYHLGAIVLMLLLLVIVAAYASLSGFRAVIRTDVQQFTLICGMVIAVWVTIFNWGGDLLRSYAEVFPLPWSFEGLFNPIGEGVWRFMTLVVGMNILFWGGWWPTAMDHWQRCAATRDPEVALDPKLGTAGWISTLYFSALSLTFLAVGSLVRVTLSPRGGDPEPLFTFLREVTAQAGLSGGWGPWGVLGLIAAGLVASLVSTTDTYMVVATQSAISDVWIALKHRLNLSEADRDQAIRERYLPIAKAVLGVFPILIVSVAFAMKLVTDLFTLIYGFFALMFALLPLILVTVVYGGRPEKKRAAFYSLVVGAIWSVVFVSLIIVRIEATYAGAGDVAYWYNWLYAASPATALFTWLVYVVVPKNQEDAGVMEVADHGEI